MKNESTRSDHSYSIGKGDEVMDLESHYEGQGAKSLESGNLQAEASDYLGGFKDKITGANIKADTDQLVRAGILAPLSLDDRTRKEPSSSPLPESKILADDRARKEPSSSPLPESKILADDRARKEPSSSPLPEPKILADDRARKEQQSKAVEAKSGHLTVDNGKELKKGDQHPPVRPEPTKSEKIDVHKTSSKPEQIKSRDQETLFNKNATPEEKILAAKKLAKEGQNQLKGEDGKIYRINLTDYGKREGVVVTVGGIPALRGLVEKSDNRVSRQKDRSGKEVDYAGDRARKIFKDDPVVSFKRK